ncbi:MAG: hypothetical protein PHT60_12955 [Acidiphilium sp.]|nr:hypothetical protein [Acidiphilium sp.]MDD4936670.1 hypothetical protein [Acidiphilium sp.]
MENKTKSPGTKPVALFVIPGGGFTFETKCLLGQLKDDLEFIYLTTRFGGEPGTEGIPPGIGHEVPMFSSLTQPSWRQSLKAFMVTFFTTLSVIREDGVGILVAVGGSHAVPMLLAGRMMRRKTVFIESITRVDKLSNTGRLVYSLHIASCFIVQWPNLKNSFPSSRLGSIL